MDLFNFFLYCRCVFRLQTYTSIMMDIILTVEMIMNGFQPNARLYAISFWTSSLEDITYSLLRKRICRDGIRLVYEEAEFGLRSIGSGT